VAKLLSRTVVVSDLHVGSTVGLWPGRHPVEGGGIYEANVFQQWLLKCWQAAVAEIVAMRPRPILVINGDPVQGVNMRDGQLITNKIDIQIAAAQALLEPICKVAIKRYFVRGTEWHEGKAAEYVELLAQRLNAVKDPSSGQWSWWELYLDVGGPVVHFAHHIGCSSVPWYEATVPLRDTLLLLAEIWRFFGQKGPNVRAVVRSHRHRFIAVDAPPDIHAVVTPAWQLKGAFSYKKATSMMPEIGFVILEWDGVDLIVRKRIYQLPEQHVEVMT
jgi:hypothetical protein